jgi:hypothetical protein
MGVAYAHSSPHRRTRPRARLPPAAGKRDRRRVPRTRQDDAREESRPPGDSRGPFRALPHSRRLDPRSHPARHRPRAPTPPPLLHAARAPRH